MTKLEDKRVLERASSLENRHRSEWADLVHDAVVGRTMTELAKLLDRSTQWVSDHLKLYVVNETLGVRGGNDRNSFKRDDITMLVQKYRPSKPSQEAIYAFESRGHTPEVAKSLSLARQATEKALRKKAVKESHRQESDRFLEEALPPSTKWHLELSKICSKVRSAIHAIDTANMNDLKRAETRIRLSELHAAWLYQMERIGNFHDTFQDEVKTREAQA